ncbi:hypothetical protein [Paraburkholderia flagellata]|uniref:hypothetical protein n=1 Tax=Paraburkholderia flagellata TaxID=2883241 RepID=UPI001F466C32|nr:hypothetical protein [Paraburkholderia flagellata]
MNQPSTNTVEDFPITSTIPCPPRITPKPKYPFARMHEGDSFPVPDAIVHRVRKAAWRYSRRHPECRFIVRRARSGAYRCWRASSGDYWGMPLTRDNIPSPEDIKTLGDYLPPEVISKDGAFRVDNPFRSKRTDSYPISPFVRIRTDDESPQLMTAGEIDWYIDYLKARSESLREPAKRELLKTGTLQLRLLEEKQPGS